MPQPSKMSGFSRFFRTDPTDEDGLKPEEITEAEELCAWAALPYFQKYLNHLDKEASKPAVISDHVAMIQSAVRSNTLRAEKEYLTVHVKRAQNALARLREERQSG